MERSGILTAAVLALVLAGAAVAAAVGRDDAPRGKRIYGRYCQPCHGAEGRGDGWIMFHPPVTDLTADRVKRMSDEELLTGIHQGRANTAMGSWRLVLGEEERQDVVAYIRGLQQR